MTRLHETIRQAALRRTGWFTGPDMTTIVDVSGPTALKVLRAMVADGLLESEPGRGPRAERFRVVAKQL